MKKRSSGITSCYAFAPGNISTPASGIRSTKSVPRGSQPGPARGGDPQSEQAAQRCRQARQCRRVRGDETGVVSDSAVARRKIKAICIDIIQNGTDAAVRLISSPAKSQ
jgi:hypothetical protein